MGVLSNLEPKEVFRYFEEICAIPHGSGDTKRISDHLMKFASEQGLRAQQDELGDVIIWKKGSAGYETSEPVMLQGHIDMVCEKDPGCTIDFKNDGLTLRVDNGVITAEGTTLGGDDGIAVAYMMAVLASDDIEHPPIEAIFTVDEETGMYGAAALDVSPLSSHRMLNVDSENEGYLLVSCAGGASIDCVLPVEREEIEGCHATVAVCGGLGGHSGVEIDKGRSSSNQVLGRALYRLSREYDIRIISAAGGKKDNVIPAESAAGIVFVKGTDADGAGELIDKLNAELKQEFAVTDPDVHVELTLDGEADTAAGEQTLEPMTKDVTERFITALVNLPYGVQRMSFDIPDLVQTSLNLGILKTTEESAVMSFSVRSSVMSEREELILRLESLMHALGGTIDVKGSYPAWEYRKESPLRDLMINVFEEQYGRKPVVHAIHAGVECGLFAGKIPDLDCVSFGPDIKEIHTPRENLDAASVKRTWEFLLEVLRGLK